MWQDCLICLISAINVTRPKMDTALKALVYKECYSNRLFSGKKVFRKNKKNPRKARWSNICLIPTVLDDSSKWVELHLFNTNAFRAPLE